MKVLSRDDLVNKLGLFEGETNKFKGMIHESGIEHCKYKTYFGVIDSALKGENSYSAMGTIFGRGCVTQTDKDEVISFLKHSLPDCSVVIKDLDTSNDDMYIGMIEVNWD